MNDANDNPLPHLIRYFREKKKYTQEQVASMLCVSRSTYSSYETGRIMPGMQQIAKLSQILEHDFLFAYAFSLQHRAVKNASLPDGVYEDNPYHALMASDDPYRNLAADIRQLEPKEQDLLQTYISIRLKEQEKTNKNET